jgi:hypothetical protein
MKNTPPIPAIPGNSLTGEPGGYPWEQPPMYSTLDQVVSHYTDLITTEKGVNALLSLMKDNISLMDIAQVMTKSGLMKGVQTIGDMNDIGYVVENEDFEEATEVDEETALEVLRGAVAEVKQAPAVRQSGLMAKE